MISSLPRLILKQFILYGSFTRVRNAPTISSNHLPGLISEDAFSIGIWISLRSK